MVKAHTYWNYTVIPGTRAQILIVSIVLVTSQAVAACDHHPQIIILNALHTLWTTTFLSADGEVVIADVKVWIRQKYSTLSSTTSTLPTNTNTPPPPPPLSTICPSFIFRTVELVGVVMTWKQDNHHVGWLYDSIVWCCWYQNSRVSHQNGVSLLYIMLEIHHSGREPWKYTLTASQKCSQASLHVDVLISVVWSHILLKAFSFKKSNLCILNVFWTCVWQILKVSFSFGFSVYLVVFCVYTCCFLPVMSFSHVYPAIFWLCV